MLTKLSQLARTFYILLAIVAGFFVLGTMDIALILVVLGLVAGISLPKERMVLAAATIIVLPIVGSALLHIPMIGGQLNAITGNLQLAMAGSFATALLIALFGLAMEGVSGMSDSEPSEGRKAATAG
jgi:hypothetical protein